VTTTFERSGEAAASPHYARDALARSWRWSCHWATIPRHRGTGPEAYLSVRCKVRDPRTPGLRLCKTGRRQGVGMVCGAKRIRSLYLPWMTGVTPKLSTTTPPKGPASLSTINAATMRLCRADLPASAHLFAAGSRSHSVSPHRAYSSERRTAISAVAAGGSCIMRARHPLVAHNSMPSSIEEALLAPLSPCRELRRATPTRSGSSSAPHVCCRRPNHASGKCRHAHRCAR
jgi:hypothetical protein